MRFSVHEMSLAVRITREKSEATTILTPGAFLIECASRYARSTTADIASTVRSFARFLLASGRIRVDLADGMISPVQPKFERPRRALPWEDVQRLLRAVDTSTACGLRDHALLLMMSTYPNPRPLERTAIRQLLQDAFEGGGPGA